MHYMGVMVKPHHQEQEEGKPHHHEQEEVRTPRHRDTAGYANSRSIGIAGATKNRDFAVLLNFVHAWTIDLTHRETCAH